MVDRRVAAVLARVGGLGAAGLRRDHPWGMAASTRRTSVHGGASEPSARRGGCGRARGSRGEATPPGRLHGARLGASRLPRAEQLDVPSSYTAAELGDDPLSRS